MHPANERRYLVARDRGDGSFSRNQVLVGRLSALEQERQRLEGLLRLIRDRANAANNAAVGGPDPAFTHGVFQDIINLAEQGIARAIARRVLGETL